MKYRFTEVLILILMTLPLLISSCDGPKPKTKPNILIIMADDMGFSDLGCTGGEIKTKNLDQLADNGILFTHFYNNARCCPTRASLLTGLFPHQTGVGWMTVRDLGTESYAGELNKSCVTIAEVLKDVGYNTFMSGKWHLTLDENAKAEGNKSSWPLQRGFNRFFGTILGAGSFYTPATLTVQNNFIEPPEDFYYTNAISDTAVKMLKENSLTDDPFFMYVAYTAPHWPLHAPGGSFDSYLDIYTKGWDAIREERYKRLIDLEIIDRNWELSKRNPDAPAWKSLTDDKKYEMALRMAVYAAQIEIMDQGIGRIIEQLRESDELENTIILFLMDNGGCAEYISSGSKDLELLGTDESFESYRLPWANVSNTPFRLFKHWTHEGGVASPLIFHWPEGVKNPGRISERPGQLMDIMATCVEIAQAEYPLKHEGNNIYPLVGESMLDAINDENDIRNKTLFWEHEANRAVRDGKWKLVLKASHDYPFDGEWELYDLEADRTETNNLSEKYPEKVEEMKSSWEKWAKQNDVYPLDNRLWHERLNDPEAITRKFKDIDN